jgi:hypothetical protein
MVENFSAHTKTCCDKQWKHLKKFLLVQTFLQTAEAIEMFATGGTGVSTCCIV